ncbi:MAG: PilZ domain-containing protein [Pseudomonadota bacterium]|nr:PilZ domain-containing protein [Pseudomonadota bacterium]
MNRRPPRKNLLFYLEVIDQQTQTLLGHLGDISMKGIMIIAHTPLTIHEIRNISIKLPDLEEFSKKSIEAQIEVRWCKMDVNPELYCLGCQFLEINTDNAAIVQEAQEILGFSEEL